MTSPVDPDSRARTHLANERTFLAWFRTGLTLLALGLAAGQFLSRDVASGFPLVRAIATVLVATGMFLVSVGVVRYVRGRARIDTAEFHPANASILVAAGAGLAAGVLGIVFLWLLPDGGP
jgi:putative membrane protein